MKQTSDFVAVSMDVLKDQENFWLDLGSCDLHSLIRYAFHLGFFPFAGYLVHYTIRGTVWNVWPFVHTTLDVGSGLVFAALQWIFFSTFPVLSSLILESLTKRWKQRIEFEDAVMIATFSMTPLCLAMLFVGVPYVDRIFTTLGFATFLFMLYCGFRLALNFTIFRSVLTTILFFVLFALIRQLFVFAIGY